MKVTGITILFVLLCLPLWAQNSFVKEIYFDEEETRLKELITMHKADSSLNGLYQSMYENGSLAIKGYYENGKSDSTWIYYFENGRQKAKGSFDQGLQTGKWRYYFENGKLKHQGNFAQGKKNGTWTYYYENGPDKSTGAYRDDQKEGIWNYFFEDGSLKAQAYYENGIGTYKGFYPSGKLKTEGKNVDEKSEGVWDYFYESGEKEASGSFSNGLRHGQWKYFHKNGEPAAEGHYVNGDKAGVWRYYYPDGSLSSEGEMLNDQKDGFWKLYYIGGEVKGEGRYDKGTGEYVEYYPSGKQKARGQLLNGEKHGRWTYFNEEGLEDGQAHYEHGVGVYQGFYEDGTLKMKGKVEDGKRTGTWTLYNPDGSIAGTYTPVYEEEKPIFRTSEIHESNQDKKTTDKPEYHYKKKKLRYFDARINEYNAVIIATNPLWMPLGKLPVSVEYYIQERLGHEAQVTFYNKPFFQDHNQVEVNTLHRVGAELTIRQKFYHEDQTIGMFYFGHQLSGGFLQHTANYLDSTFHIIPPIQRSRSSNETRFAYGLFVGTRWAKRAGDSGLTVDFNLGLGVGTRTFHLQEDENTQSDYIFTELNGDKIYLPIIFTLNIGFAGPKRRSTSF